jgi:hypothetical protein
MATIGVIADPEAPAEIGRHLQTVLPGLLSRRFGGGRGWNVVVRQERLPIGPPRGHDELLCHASDLRREEHWVAALCVTDLPLKDSNGKPLVADLSRERRVAILSLPAFGATRLRRRVTDVAVKVLADLIRGETDAAPTETTPEFDDRGMPGPFRVITPDDADIDVRVVATRGSWRQFVGMVRANRPWRLLLGLRTAVAAALGFSAFWLINLAIWQLSNAQGIPRLVVISICAVLAIVGWLIIYHDLWERGGQATIDRHESGLFNASTVVTLVIGVATAFTGLLLLNLAAAYLVIDKDSLAQQLHGADGSGDYVKLTWLATSGACVVGGLGAGFESDQAVREAAYSQREQERRREWRRRWMDHREEHQNLR